MKERCAQTFTLMDAVAANGWSTPVDVRNYKHLILVISTASSGAGTLKVAGSILPSDDVTFSTAAAVDNEWDYIAAYNLEDAAAVEGDTGVVYAGTDAVEQLIINTYGMTSIAVNLSGYSAGAFDVKLFVVNNQ